MNMYASVNGYSYEKQKRVNNAIMGIVIRVLVTVIKYCGTYKVAAEEELWTWDRSKSF